MQKRALGKTGEMLSMVGFGGIVVMNEEPAAARHIVAQAVERGINYFDVAPTYGNAQERLGPALEPYRQGVFLACKTTQRTRSASQAELDESLRLLRTDRFDLYQFHGVKTVDEVETIFGPDGAMQTFQEARRRGVIRYIGFSAHTEEAAIAMLERFPFDSMLFPLNWVCWHQAHFGPRALAAAQSHGVGVLALKTLAKSVRPRGAQTAWPKCWYYPVDTPAEALTAVRFTFSRPITAGTSPSHAELLWWFCDAAERFTPLSEAEEAEVARRTDGLQPIFPHQGG